MIKKIIMIDNRASKEFEKLPDDVANEFTALLKELKYFGFLEFPNGRKLGNLNFFEIRVKRKGAWRAIYTYIDKNKIVILSFFRKKSQKTRKKEIQKAQTRLKFNK